MAAGSSISVALTDGGDVVSWGAKGKAPWRANAAFGGSNGGGGGGGGVPCVAVAAGGQYAMAVTRAKGNVWFWCRCAC